MQANETVPYALNTECVNKSPLFFGGGARNCSKTEYLTDRVTLTNEVTNNSHLCQQSTRINIVSIKTNSWIRSKASYNQLQSLQNTPVIRTLTLWRRNFTFKF